MTRHTRRGERGTLLVVILFISSAIAALAAIMSGRVVTETRQQRVLEHETRAYQEAYTQLQLALNIVNTSAYDDTNANLELKGAMAGDNGGTAGGEADSSYEWLKDPAGIVHGKVRTTDVRVYRGKDYILRLAKIKGTTATAVDPGDQSRAYYVIEALGRAGDTTRVVSALVRESEPFSSFVFFQNRHPLGVSGAPRGLIHSNEQLAFYFPNGDYQDGVSAVSGFTYEAGASSENTNITDGNPEAAPISLEDANFAELQSKADLFLGTAGMDAEIRLQSNGHVEVKEYTRPRWDEVERSYTYNEIVGYETRTVTETVQVQVGSHTEERTRQVQVGTTTETYNETIQVQVGTTTEERTRQVPVYGTRTVTRTRQVRVFVPYDNGEGGTAVGGGGEGVPGEYVWVDEEYEAEETYIVRYDEETYTVEVPIYEDQVVEREREVPIYETEIYTVEVPDYEEQEVEVEEDFPIYEERTSTYMDWEHTPPSLLETHDLVIPELGGTMFIDGRITRLRGDLNGRLTIVGNEKVRVTGNIRYVDDAGETAMNGGGDYNATYERNTEYIGKSVLGVIARDDIVLTHDLPNNAEINATLLSAFGRVGIDGFQIDENGDPVKDHYYGLSWEEILIEAAYDYTEYETERFRRDSLRRLGGIVSNDRILETYIRARSDGTSYVDSGFKRGRMRYDFNLMFNPPPNFVEVPRPVVTSIVPIYLVRENEN